MPIHQSEQGFVMREEYLLLLRCNLTTNNAALDSLRQPCWFSKRVCDLTQRLDDHNIEHQHRYRRSRKSSTGCGGLRALYMLMASAIWLAWVTTKESRVQEAYGPFPFAVVRFHTSALPAWEKKPPLENRWLANNLNSWAYDDRRIKRQVWEIYERSKRPRLAWDAI